jgi:hypothetical protein
MGTRLADQPAPGAFAESELDGLPEPVCRYLRASIEPGTPLARSARFRMRGSIKLGRRWISFRASEVLAPQHGFVWAARAGGVIAGFDRYARGDGMMDWKLLGLKRVAHGKGRDVSRSSAGRVGAEAVWVPTALLPRFGVTWASSDPRQLLARYRLDDSDLELHLTLDDEARVRSVVLDRWGDPDSSGSWGYHPFGFEATGCATFGGVTIASAGRAGWFFGTERWTEGFRYEITEYELVTKAQ